MTIKQFMLYVLLFVLVPRGMADTSTIVLQNGLNGYEGCEDTYNFNESADENYAHEEEIHTFNCIP